MKRKLKTVTRRLEKADKLLAAMKAVGDAVCDCLAGSLCVALNDGGDAALEKRLKSSQIVEHSVTTHGEPVAGKLAERAQGLPGDFSALDFLAVLLFLQALQASARHQLAAADHMPARRRGGAPDPRRPGRPAGLAPLESASVVEPLRSSAGTQGF